MLFVEYVIDRARRAVTVLGDYKADVLLLDGVLVLTLN